ncbi:hypothetical protein ABH926_000700 [Catenulispora sp. GP43]|uniref:cell wall-binding repeat-containing protein n=1 Tax=Catenulispora sp. GP43 TaxID=3156263 RepID=UPI0035198ADD
MSKFSGRRPLALSAILSTSLIPALGFAAPSAHAVNPGPADSSLTISDGTQRMLVDGQPLTFPTTVTDATWSPNGSRVAFVDATGDLVSTLPDGSRTRVLAHGGPGIAISSPTWSSDGSSVAFAESVNGALGPIKLAKADGYGTSASGGGDGSDIADLWTPYDGAAYSSPDAVYAPDGTDPSTNTVPNYVFQKTPAGSSTAQIWSIRKYAGGWEPYKIADGTQPTVSPDGRTVAFIDGSWQLAVVDISNPFQPSAPKVLTHLDDLQLSHPAFSPDCTRIAFETSYVRMGAPSMPNDVEAIPAAGGTPAVVSQHPGVPAYRPTALTHVTRLAGADRIGTAIAISKAEYPDATLPAARPTTVLLARSDQYADALAGSVLAKNGPLLLTPSAALDPAVRAEIVRVLGPAHHGAPVVTLLGGTQALSPAVQKAITDLGYGVKRLGGPDRFATAVDIAQSTIKPGPYDRTYVVATGDDFADALSASATGHPILLTDGKVMPPVTAAFLKEVRYPPTGGAPTFYEVGGQAKTAIETSGATGTARTIALAGTDRFETSFMVAREFFGAAPARPGRLYLGAATAFNWPDSLAGGAAMAKLSGPMLLVDPQKGLSTEEQQWVSANSGSVDSALVFGGLVALPGGIDTELGTNLSGPAGYVTATDPASIPR